MNRYVSTYQKDYTWPDTLGVRRPPSPPIGTVKDTPCRCIDVQRVLAELLDTNGEWSRDWGRAGPMGRLLEPRLYAIKIETKVPARRDRPRVCARQVNRPSSSFSSSSDISRASRRSLASHDASRDPRTNLDPRFHAYNHRQINKLYTRESLFVSTRSSLSPLVSFANISF